MTRRHLSALAALLAAAHSWTGCRERAATDEINAAGHVEATTVRISSRLGGTIEWMDLAEGNEVREGQPVARLDTTDSRLLLASAVAERDLATAELALREAGPRPEDIAEARAHADAARAESESAARDLSTLQGLLDAGSGTEKSRDDARSRRDVAASMLDAARQRLQRLESGSRPEEIAAARARVGAASARMAQIEEQIRDATVESPVDAIVTERLAEPGEVVPPGAPLAILTRLRQPWLTIYLPEPDLGRIRIGQAATVRTDDGQEREGKVVYVSSVAEFTPRNVQTRDERVKLVFRVKLSLTNDDGLFKPGMPAEARLLPAPPGAP